MINAKQYIRFTYLFLFSILKLIPWLIYSVILFVILTAGNVVQCILAIEDACNDMAYSFCVSSRATGILSAIFFAMFNMLYLFIINYIIFLIHA